MESYGVEKAGDVWTIGLARYYGDASASVVILVPHTEDTEHGDTDETCD